MQSDFPIFIGFIEKASRYTQNIASIAWVIYSSFGQLVSSSGVSLGLATNNITKYYVIIEFLSNNISLGIRHIIIFLDL